ncbi:hypothetical protein ACLX1H_003143 [Fusarium chlamydosporum]
MSTERQTINIPSTKDQPTTEPYYVMDDRSKAALKDLQEGDLLQLTVDHAEEEINFAHLNRQIAPDDLAQYFQSPEQTKFAFYRHPGSGAVILIWTQFPLTASTKKRHVQNRMRRELTWLAEKEGITTVDMLQVFSQKDMTSERLQAVIGSSTAPKEP